MLRVGAGGAGSQAINLLSMPLLSRVFDPGDVATWVVMMATVQVAGALASLRYEVAIVLPPEDERGSAVAWLALLLGLCTAAIFGLALLNPALREFVLPADSESGWVVWLTPILVLLLAINNVLANWCVRNRRYGLQSWALTSLAAATCGGQLLLGIVWRADGAALVLGSTLGLLVSVAIASLGGVPRPPRGASGFWRHLRDVAVGYRRFPLFSTPYSVFGLLRDRVGILLLNGYYSGNHVGWYGWAYRVVNFPVTLAGGSIRPVVFREASEHGVASVQRPVLRILTGLAVIATPVLVLFLVYPRELFVAAFGPRWAGSADLAVVLVWPALLFMFSSWMDRLLDVLGQQHISLLLEAIFGTASVVALWLGCHLGLDLRAALIAPSCVLVLYNIVYLIVVFRRARYPMRSLVVRLGILLGLGLTCAGALLLLRAVLVPLAAICVFVAAAGLALVLFRRQVSRLIAFGGATRDEAK